MKLRFLGMGRERIAISLTLATLFTTTQNAAMADVFSLRTYFEQTNFAVQHETDLWTARWGSTTGLLLAPYPGATVPHYRGGDLPLETPRFGPFRNVPAVPTGDPMEPTFNGLFAHPASVSPLAIVFRADETLYVNSLTVYAEGVNAAAGTTGMDIAVVQTIGGATSGIGGFFFDAANTVNTAQIHTYLDGAMLQLSPGDTLTIFLGNHGDYFADHANLNVVIETDQPPAIAVPEAASLVWMAPALLALGRFRGKSRQRNVL